MSEFHVKSVKQQQRARMTLTIIVLEFLKWTLHFELVGSALKCLMGALSATLPFELACCVGASATSKTQLRILERAGNASCDLPLVVTSAMMWRCVSSCSDGGALRWRRFLQRVPSQAIGSRQHHARCSCQQKHRNSCCQASSHDQASAKRVKWHVSCVCRQPDD